MPNVCCAGHHWFSHKFGNDNYFLFSSRVCLKDQLSIFTTQALLELPKVARNSHGNSFIPGLSPLAGILLDHYCRLTATCVHLFTVDLYPITCKDDISTEMSCVWTWQIEQYMHIQYLIPMFLEHALNCYATVDTDFYGLVLWNIPSQITACLWNSSSRWLRQMFQLCWHRPGISLCSCSIFAPKAEISPKLATHEGLLMHCMSYFYAISVLASWVTAVKIFMQLPCIFAHLRILLRTYARRVVNKFVRAGIDVAYAGDSTD